VHQPKVAIHVVEVKEQTFAVLADELELPVSHSLYAEALADLNTPQHADQTLADLISSGNVQCDLILVPRPRLQVLKRPTRRLRDALPVPLQLIAQSLRELAKLRVSNVTGSQEVLQATRITDRTQAPPEKQAVKTVKDPKNLLRVTFQKCSHDSPPFWMKQDNI